MKVTFLILFFFYISGERLHQQNLSLKVQGIPHPPLYSHSTKYENINESDDNDEGDDDELVVHNREDKEGAQPIRQGSFEPYTLITTPKHVHLVWWNMTQRDLVADVCISPVMYLLPI